MALSAPLAAQTPTAPVAVQTLPSNSVACVYASMSAEDREMSLLLLAREIVDGGSFRKGSRNVRAVDRLIEEAHQKCLARFKWTAKRSNAATGYAMTAILGEALDQALESYGRPLAALTGFYAANRTSLIGRSDLTAAEQQLLTTQLKKNGWAEASSGELSLAGLYVETLMLKDQANREFNAAAAVVRPPIRRQRGQAATTRRGKP